jgi:hypothetical protein
MMDTVEDDMSIPHIPEADTEEADLEDNSPTKQNQGIAHR